MYIVSLLFCFYHKQHYQKQFGEMCPLVNLMETFLHLRLSFLFHVYQGLCQVNKNELTESNRHFFHEKPYNVRLAGGNRSMEGRPYRLVLYLCSGPERLFIGSPRCETSCYPLSSVWPISCLPPQDRLHLLKLGVKTRALALIFSYMVFFSQQLEKLLMQIIGFRGGITTVAVIDLNMSFSGLCNCFLGSI